MVFEPQIETFARDLGATADMIRQWRSRRVIPWEWRFKISEEARKRGEPISPKKFDANGKKRRAA